VKLNSWIGKIGDGSRNLFQRKLEAANPPILSSGMRNPYGALRFKARIGKNVGFEIQASTNLKDWRTVVSDTAPDEVVEYVDSDAHNFSYRFYRVLAGTVYSENTFGYATITLPPGHSSIANPFQSSASTVGELFADMPEGARFHKFDASAFVVTENMLTRGKWARPSERFVPGEGAIIFNPTTEYRPLSFIGNVMQGSFSVPIPSGFSMRSSLVPRPGQLVADLGFPMAEGDVIHVFDREKQDYVLHKFNADKWATETPVIGVAESFWVAKTIPGTWKQSMILDVEPVAA